MIWEKIKEGCKNLRASIDSFNKSKLPYLSINYLFIAKVAGDKMRQIIDKDTAEQSTPQVNNAKSTKTKLTLNKKILFKDLVSLLPHSSFHILSHQIAPESMSNGFNSTS